MSSLPKASARKRAPRKATAPRNLSSNARTAILAAALKIFARDTFDGASLQEIARRANVGQPLVHYHFGSKEELWKATVDYALSDLKDFFQSVSLTTVDLQPVDTIRVLCRAFLRFAAERPEHGLIMMHEARAHGERFEWLMEKYTIPIHRDLDALIERGIELGQLKDIPPAHSTSAILILLLHFYTIGPMIRAIYGLDVTDPAIVSDHTDHMMTLIFDGILAKPA
ncbi:MAG: hypothetical protein DI569_00015 [Sphingopyxis macrogoltabida]|uniref:HTH tetR-type domain-containing protein n=1 Tax=Sphingopyxis macrogoltabida TaxID=33050 RepID=A0A2W5LAW8_SPHMC|nr:MAG: hypothetical protein DI569_00015 [Sphingopyxis macrogoltabida]